MIGTEDKALEPVCDVSVIPQRIGTQGAKQYQLRQRRDATNKLHKYRRGKDSKGALPRLLDESLTGRAKDWNGSWRRRMKSEAPSVGV